MRQVLNLHRLSDETLLSSHQASLPAEIAPVNVVWPRRPIKIGLMQLSVVKTLQCLVKGEALVSLCLGHAAMIHMRQAVEAVRQSLHCKHPQVRVTHNAPLSVKSFLLS